MISLEQLYAIFQQHPVVSTDTRKLPQGCLFFALKGEHFDGNAFAAQALENGAAFAVVDDPRVAISDRFLLTPDALETLQQLANHHRRQFDIPVVAIGGSNGKTTTKELTAAVLSKQYPCHYTKGNLNNHIGVPLTLLQMPSGTEIAVIEMGTNQAGDIEQLCNIVAPTHGLLTNIGKEHLEGFGSLSGVKKAEGELYRYLGKNKGWIFLNTSEKYLPAMCRNNVRKIIYHQAERFDPNDGRIEVRLEEVAPYVRASFLADDGNLIEINSQLIGNHNFNNIMTAIALGIYFKVSAAKIKEAIEHYVPANNRSQVLRLETNIILLDAYNANPSSMTPALKTLKAMPARRRIAIMGDMLELGQASDAEHQAMVNLAARCKFDQVILVGPEFGKTRHAGPNFRHFTDAAAAKTWWQQQHLEHAAVLLKGSRGMKLETILS
jgi:UDP-N-acetylmuramoyl-tripeptide--D-alanyl-D-alanine ligase